MNRKLTESELAQFGLNIDVSHHDRSARRGETVCFAANLQRYSSKAPGYEIYAKIIYNGGPVVKECVIPSGSYAQCVEFVPEKAGCYRCEFEAGNGDQIIKSGTIGVLVEPETIAPALPVPADFDGFWRKHLDQLHALPLKAECTPVEQSGSVRVEDVQINCIGGKNVSGILIEDRSLAEKQKLPAILTLQGAGVRTAAWDYSLLFARNGFLSFDVNAHGVPNCRTPEFYHELALAGIADPVAKSFESGDPEKVYMLGMFLRGVRAAEYLMSRPEWDGKNLFVAGGSQGAWQSIAVAALCRKVTALSVMIPAGSDMASGGWPFHQFSGSLEIPDWLRKTAPYFDNCSMASRIDRIPVFLQCGLSDNVCNANGVMAFYNSLKTPQKSFSANPMMQHEFPENCVLEMMRFLRSRII